MFPTFFTWLRLRQASWALEHPSTSRYRMPPRSADWAGIACKTPRNSKICLNTYGYGSIPIHTIFSGMNIHLPAILGFTRGTRVLTHPHIKEIEFATILLWASYAKDSKQIFQTFPMSCQEELQEAMDKMPEEVWLAGCWK